MSEAADNSTSTDVESTVVEALAAAGIRALVIVGPGKIAAGYDLVIVCEGRTDEGALAATSGYPAGADLYFRTDEAVAFPKSAKEVLTLGVDIQQLDFWGFTLATGFVNVGPAHPAFAAANLAYQRGATSIDIRGLTDGEKERLRPWIDDLPSNAVVPAQVAVSL